MANIPHGLRLAALAFEAQDPGAGIRPVNLPLVNVSAVGGDGAALPLLTKALKELGSRTVTIEKIEISGASKTGEQLFREIVDAASRAGAAGDPTSWLSQ
jgi:hypothetical protein